MRIKDGKGKTTELIFLITASVLTVALLIYVVWLIKHVVSKSDAVFQIDQNVTSGVPSFNFAQYEKLFGPITSTIPITASTTTATTSKR